jgi:23S rRNA U2552 (ribose-2'-O)-methylase RlmE/FtsJ
MFRKQTITAILPAQTILQAGFAPASWSAAARRRFGSGNRSFSGVCAGEKLN